MMDAPETATLTVPARREAFAALSAWLEARLAPLNPSPKARRQLLVAADEILTNVATYAYPPDAPGELQVTLRHADGTLSLTFADRGVPYDPLSAPPPDLSLPLAERAPGGLGLFIVRKTMDAVAYRRDGDRNLLTLTKRLAP